MPLKIWQNLQENIFVGVSSVIKLKDWSLSGFPVNFAKFLRTPLLHNISGQLLQKKLSFRTRVVLKKLCSRSVFHPYFLSPNVNKKYEPEIFPSTLKYQFWRHKKLWRKAIRFSNHQIFLHGSTNVDFMQAWVTLNWQKRYKR